MKVNELIGELLKCDRDTEVYIGFHNEGELYGENTCIFDAYKTSFPHEPKKVLLLEFNTVSCPPDLPTTRKDTA